MRVNTYFACLLFDSHVEDESGIAPLRDESIRLIVAKDEDDARRKAEELGKELEHDYENEDGSRVWWRFVSLIDIQEFCEDELADGVEVYSRLNRKGT